MHCNDAIQLCLDAADMISMMYLQDLSDEEMMIRPAPGMNHINWQVGHLIASEYEMLRAGRPDTASALPEGFLEQYSKEQAQSDNPADFRTKEELLALYQAQRAISLNSLAAEPDDAFEKPSGVPYAPNMGALYSMLGTHWLMHSGQWVVVRRNLGRPPLF